MPQYICPSCGSKYFVATKVGPKIIFTVMSGRKVQFIQSVTGTFADVFIGTKDIYCCLCSWKGSLNEVLEDLKEKEGDTWITKDIPSVPGLTNEL